MQKGRVVAASCPHPPLSRMVHPNLPIDMGQTPVYEARHAPVP
jgi:hypothetical protein